MADSNYISFRCPESLRAMFEHLSAVDERSLSDEIRRSMRFYAKHRQVYYSDGEVFTDAPPPVRPLLP